MKMKKITSAALALGLALGLAGCGGNQAAGGSDLEYIKEKGTMVIGYTVYEPMNYTDENGEFTGFDTELATAVCEQLGVTPEFQEINRKIPPLTYAACSRVSWTFCPLTHSA